MAETYTCVVCDEPAGELESSVCNNCGERFHLNQRNDVPGKDCGAVWINDQYLALEFACQRCLDGDLEEPASRPRPAPVRRRRRYRKWA